jgi:hypothetical protein
MLYVFLPQPVAHDVCHQHTIQACQCCQSVEQNTSSSAFFTYLYIKHLESNNWDAIAYYLWKKSATYLTLYLLIFGFNSD